MAGKRFQWGISHKGKELGGGLVYSLGIQFDEYSPLFLPYVDVQ